MIYSEKELSEEFVWEIKVPILKNSFILKQLGFAIGIPFGLLLVALIVVKAYNGLFLLGLTFGLALILFFIIFKGTYDVRYKLAHSSISCFTQKPQQRRVKVLSILTVVLGLLKKNPTSTGIGLLSYNSTKVTIPFERIRKIKYIEPKRTIIVYGGFAENIAVFCTEENYNFVERFIKTRRSESA